MSRAHRAGRALGVLAAVASLSGCLACLGCGPLGPLPGGRLRGEVRSAPPPDWSFTSEVETVQVETRPADPYSVNTWCGDYRGALYVPTSLIFGADDPAERDWVKHVLSDPRVRLRIGGIVYELRAVRVEDAEEREAVRARMLAKYDVELDDHAENAWIFRMEAR